MRKTLVAISLAMASISMAHAMTVQQAEENYQIAQADYKAAQNDLGTTAAKTSPWADAMRKAGEDRMLAYKQARVASNQGQSLVTDNQTRTASQHTTQSTIDTMAPGISKESNPAGNPTYQIAPATHLGRTQADIVASSQAAMDASKQHDNVVRTAGQHVDAQATYVQGAATHLDGSVTDTQRLQARVDAQAQRDNGQDLAIQDAHSVASHAQTQANTNAAHISDINDVVSNHDTRIGHIENKVTSTEVDVIRLNNRLDNLPTPKDGKDGKDGIDGKDGATGATGATGAAGRDGVDGHDGINGTDGKDGKDGAVGATGAKGDKGDTGATGLTGAAGKDGVDGKDGLNGTDGKDGINGTNGVDGKDGINGKDGAKGADGVTTTVTDNTKLMQETEDRQKNEALLAGSVAVAQSTGEAAQNRADVAFANAEANRKASIETNKRVAQNTADIANHEQRITSLEQTTNSKFGDLKNQIDNNKKEANAGIAGVAAMANIPQVTEGAKFSVGAGVGNRDSESAVAVGMSARLSQSVVGKASVAADTQDGFTVGAGVSYQW